MNRASVVISLGIVGLSIACADKPKVQLVQAPPPETVFVKQPVAPPPAPAPLAVSPHLVAFDAIGDTLRLSLPEGSACVAASENIATVDSTGLVRATGNGATHLRCWEGEHNAQVKVNVAQTIARVQVVADEGLQLRKSGDSLHLGMARVDRLGTPVEGERPVWASLAPQLVRVDSATGVAVARADTGTAQIVGTVLDHSDTVVVEVGTKQRNSQLLSASNRSAANSRFRSLARANPRLGPRANPGPLVNQSMGSVQNPGGIGARAAQPTDSLFQTPTTFGIQNQKSIIPSLMAGFAEHRIITTLGGLEKTSGAVYGGAVNLTPRGPLALRFQFMTGTLAADTNTASTIKLTDGSMDLSYAVAPWLSVIGGAEARRYESVRVERWVMVGAGGETNFSLGGGSLRGIARVKLMPLISVASDAGTVTAPSFGIAGAFGLGFDSHHISSSLLYDIERYTFPNGSGRKEQFGAILFQLGYRLGW